MKIRAKKKEKRIILGRKPYKVSNDIQTLDKMLLTKLIQKKGTIS